MDECTEKVPFEVLSNSTYSTASWAFVLIFVPLVAFFGILGNTAFIFVVYRVKFMQSITNIYLVNLALADCSLLITAFSQYIGDYIISPVYDLRFSFHSAFGCSLPNFLIYLCYYASLWTVTLVSIERYFAICHTFWHRLVSSKERSIRMVVAVWIISLLFSGLAAPYTPITICTVSSDNSSFQVLQTIPYCEFYCHWCSIALYFTDVLQFIIALVINIVVYALILRSLTKSAIPMELETHGENRATKTRNTVARMLVTNGIIFFICLFPFSISNIDSISMYYGTPLFDITVRYPLAWAGRVLFLVNSATNPLIYNATNPRYRFAFKQAFGITNNGCSINGRKVSSNVTPSAVTRM